jgi:predicted dehydrogenase
VAIVGCGKIADQHAEQIVRIPGCQIVGVCDREELMAEQLQERFNVPARFTEVQDLLDEAKPHVVHLTAPPQTHYPIGKLCLEAGCHLYMEKPFTVYYEEAKELIQLVELKNLKLTVSHDAQFTQASNRMRKLVREGYLGGPPLHMESYYSYNLSGGAYAKALLGDGYHWVRKLPGGLLQNTISHGVSKIAEFLMGEALEVVASGFTSELLKGIGETEIVDELRVIICDRGTTAYFTFSSQMQPSLHMLRLYGPKNGLIVDQGQQTVIKVTGNHYKSYLEQFLPPWGYANQYVGNALGNMKKFVTSDFHMDYGKRFLISAFYRSITEGEPLPIPYAEILKTSQIMDRIFSQVCVPLKTVKPGSIVTL